MLILIFILCVSTITYNGCKLNSRLGFETLSTEILITKLNVYWTFAKRKLTNCLPLLQKPKPNAQMGFRLGYSLCFFHFLPKLDFALYFIFPSSTILTAFSKSSSGMLSVDQP